MSITTLLDNYPRKLVYLGSDPSGEALVRSLLKGSAEDDYSIKKFDSLGKIKGVDLPSYCHAVILDIRDELADTADIIYWVGELQCPVALICICKNLDQIKVYEDKLHLINDIILVDSIHEGELALHLSRAIQSRQADFERRQDQELLSALLDSVPDSIYFKDRDCRFIRVNKAKAGKHFESPEEMVGKSDLDYFTEERARPAYEEEQHIMRSGEPVLGAAQKLTFDDGSVGWVNTSKLPLKDKYGRIIGTMGISRDITAQREGERDQDLLNELLDNIPDAIYFKNKKSCFIRVNKAMAEKFGEDGESLVGKSDFDLFSEEHAKQSFNDEREIMRTRQPIVGKVEKETFEGGRTKWVNTTKVPLRDKSGEVIGTMGISRDVTDQIENEQKLKEIERKLGESE